MIAAVKPNLILNGSENNPRIFQKGWFLIFKSVFINYDLFDDLAFAWISYQTQERRLLSAGDSFEAQAIFNFSQGRLIFNKVHNIDVKTKGDIISPELNQLLVAAKTTKPFPIQPDKCLRCSQGVLVEKANRDIHSRGPRRVMVCLQSEENPVDCIYHLKSVIEKSDQEL